VTRAFTISRYRPADAHGIRAIFPEFLREYAGLLESGTLLVARERGRPIGFLFVKWYAEPAYYDPAVTRYGEIMEVHVQEVLRNRGVGTALVRTTLREAKRRGCGAVYLETDDFNGAARRVYEKCGFSLHNQVIRYKRSLP
jgi:GNAT superfamily N-acetyltransferase